MHPAHPLAVLPRPQFVCPLVHSPKCTLLTLVLPPGCMSSRGFTEMHPADPLAALPCPQPVRHLVLSPKRTLLTLLRPCSTISVYVLSPLTGMHPVDSCGLSPPSGCTSYHRFTDMRPADPLATSLCPQVVCPLVHSPKCTLLTLLRPRPAGCMSSHPFTEMPSFDPLVISLPLSLYVV